MGSVLGALLHKEEVVTACACRGVYALVAAVS